MLCEWKTRQPRERSCVTRAGDVATTLWIWTGYFVDLFLFGLYYRPQDGS